MPELILASTSSARKSLLERLNIPFTALAPNIDESALANEHPSALALRLSEQKALAIAQQHPHAWVIGSDQTCALKHQLYQKPITIDKAKQQLQTFSGNVVDFYTGICLVNANSHQIFSSVESTRVHFKTLSDEKITDYLNHDLPLECAGSFKVEALGISLFNKIESEDPSALIGLPLIRLCQFLEDAKLMSR